MNDQFRKELLLLSEIIKTVTNSLKKAEIKSRLLHGFIAKKKQHSIWFHKVNFAEAYK